MTIRLKGDDATALVGGASLWLFIVIAFLEYRMKVYEAVMREFVGRIHVLRQDFCNGESDSRIFLHGNSGSVSADSRPGCTKIFVRSWLGACTHVPLSVIPVAIIIVLEGIIAGLDGSGFSGLVLVGTLAQALGTTRQYFRTRYAGIDWFRVERR